MSRRTLQVGEFLREELSDIIRREVSDPRVGFFSITQVDVSDDLRNARVFVSVLGSDEDRTRTMNALRSASTYIRHVLKPRMHTRHVPDLDFRDDRSMEHAEQIARVINDLHDQDGAPGGVTERQQGTPTRPDTEPREGRQDA